MRTTWDPTFPAVVAALGMLVGTVLATGGLAPGEWRAELDRTDHRLRLDLRPRVEGGEFRISTDVRVDEIEGYDRRALDTPGAPVALRLRREPGTFVLTGKGGRRPGGEIRFEPNAEFVERWRALDGPALAGHDLERLALEDVRISDIDALKELGYRQVSASELLRLHSRGISVDWLKDVQALVTEPDLDEVVRLHDQGVSGREIRAMAALGAGIGIEELIRLNRHGIDASYVGGLLSAGVSADDMDGIVSLRAHGVSTSYVAGLRSAGLPDASVDEIERLHDHGIDTGYVEGMVQAGLSGPSIDDLVRLQAHSVPPEFARSIVAALPASDVDSILLLHDHSVGADWVTQMSELGYGRLGPQELTRLHDHGVSLELARTLAQAGRSDLSADDLIGIHSHGLD
jgi:hypothetical protein